MLYFEEAKVPFFQFKFNDNNLIPNKMFTFNLTNCQKKQKIFYGIRVLELVGI
jgi:hypothetical protein